MRPSHLCWLAFPRTGCSTHRSTLSANHFLRLLSPLTLNLSSLQPPSFWSKRPLFFGKDFYPLLLEGFPWLVSTLPLFVCFSTVSDPFVSLFETFLPQGFQLTLCLRMTVLPLANCFGLVAWKYQRHFIIIMAIMENIPLMKYT